MAKLQTHNQFLILCLLGILSVVSPFAIDLYLAAFTKIAGDLGTNSAIVSLSVSAYFIGLAFGQLFYGPLLDRYGRKKPIYAGLSVFVLSSLGCAMTTNIELLIALRLLQGLGGCVAQVGAVTMVHDFFPVQQSAKIFSLLFLFIGASPLLAPSIGSILVVTLGWRSIFVAMALLVIMIVTAIAFLLPEGHKPDPTISLKPGGIIRTFIGIFKNRDFKRYVLAGGFSFAGLFTYVAGAPIIFMEEFHVSAKTFSFIFAGLAFGFIGGSQVNVALLRRYSSAKIFAFFLRAQVVVAALFLISLLTGMIALKGTLAFMFIFLCCTGISNPNGAALALAPFTKNAGSASALLGMVQLGTGALVSTWIGIANSKSSLPIIGILFVTALIGALLHGFLPASHKGSDTEA